MTTGRINQVTAFNPAPLFPTEQVGCSELGLDAQAADQSCFLEGRVVFADSWEGVPSNLLLPDILILSQCRRRLRPEILPCRKVLVSATNTCCWAHDGHVS